MANDNKHTALMGLENSIKNSGDLENNRYKNEAALRSPHEDDAALFDDIGNSVSAPGQRPRGLGANLAAGLSKGLAHGARTKATAEKKSKYEKHANVVNYLQQAQGEALKQNQWYEQEERRMETVKPFAVGGLEVAYSGMDYATGNERMRNIIEQAKIADPRIKGDYIGYVPNSPIVNLRTQDGEIIAYSLSNLVGEDVVNRVQKNYIDEQKMKTEQQYAPLKYEAMGAKTNAAEARVREMNQRTYQTAHQKYAPKIEAASRVKVVSGKIRDLIRENPGVYQSVLQAIQNTEEENPSALRLIAQQYSGGKKADAIKKLGKYTKELKVSAVKGLSNPNMMMDKLVAGTIVGSGFSDEAANDILDDLSTKADYEMNMNREYLNEIKGLDGESLGGGDKYAGMAQDYIDKSGGKSPSPSNNESPLAAFGKRIN